MHMFNFGLPDMCHKSTQIGKRPFLFAQEFYKLTRIPGSAKVTHVHKYNYCLGRKFHCFSMPHRWLSCTWDHVLVPEKKIHTAYFLITNELRQFGLDMYSI